MVLVPLETAGENHVARWQFQGGPGRGLIVFIMSFIKDVMIYFMVGIQYIVQLEILYFQTHVSTVQQILLEMI